MYLSTAAVYLCIVIIIRATVRKNATKLDRYLVTRVFCKKQASKHQLNTAVISENQSRKREQQKERPTALQVMPPPSPRVAGTTNVTTGRPTTTQHITRGECQCKAKWHLQDSSCYDGSVTYHGCGMKVPCDGDNGGISGQSWCIVDLQIQQQKPCSSFGVNWDYCHPDHPEGLSAVSSSSPGGSLIFACEHRTSYISDECPDSKKTATIMWIVFICLCVVLPVLCCCVRPGMKYQTRRRHPYLEAVSSQASALFVSKRRSYIIYPF